MASSRPRSRLTRLQHLVLDAFFARERGFFLTGGGALAGFYLGHRSTSELDLFTLDDDAFERGRFALRDVASALGGQLDIRQDAPGFLRAVLSARGDGVVVDLVRERVHQARPDKAEVAGVRVDPPDEIFANKLTALVGRAEERDLVDVYFLERAGLSLDSALAAATQKDGGCTPATLAWLLSQIEIPDGTALPGGTSPQELRDYLADLISRLRRAALPGAGD